jgi:excinuclease ABC subunit A
MPLDVPFDQLTARQRRVVFHGTGEDWINVYGSAKDAKNDRPLLRFQFKGLYPALEEAARLSPALRGKWEHLVGEVECSTCGGSRLMTTLRYGCTTARSTTCAACRWRLL